MKPLSGKAKSDGLSLSPNLGFSCLSNVNSSKEGMYWAKRVAIPLKEAANREIHLQASPLVVPTLHPGSSWVTFCAIYLAVFSSLLATKDEFSSYLPTLP